MKKILILPIVISSLLLSYVVYGATFGSDSKIAALDLNLIKNESLAYQRLEEEVAALRKELEDYKGDVLTEHTQALKKLTEGYEARLEEADAEEREKLKKEYEEKVKKLAAESQQKIDNKQKELEMIQDEKNLVFNEELNAAVERMVKRWKLSCVVYKSRVTAGGRDITKTVMKRIDKKYKPSFWERIFKKNRSQQETESLQDTESPEETESTSKGSNE